MQADVRHLCAALHSASKTTREKSMARLGRIFLALALVLTFAAAPSGAVRAAGSTGPIQLGGDDQNDHGSPDDETGAIWIDHDSNPATPDVVGTQYGWKYVMLSLENMINTEQRAGVSNSIAVIGTNGSSAYLASNPAIVPNDGGVSCTNDEWNNSYCMMEVARAEIDRRNGAVAAPTVSYYETAVEVDAFFDGLAAGTTNVAVIFIPGDGGPNDLDDGAAEDEVNDDPSFTSAMEQALIDAAPTIAAFNAAGGGLLSSGTDHYYSWLTVLLPNLDISEQADTCTLAMTTDGAALWTGLTDTDISSCWHNHFTGDLGALKVLALGWNNDWADADLDNMIDAGEATAASWDGPDGISGNADDAQPRVVIGGAAGEAAIGEELPETNREGDTFTYWLAIGALLTAGAGLMLRGRKTA